MTNFLYHYSYFAILVLTFLSTMGLPVGSELAIIGGGALASGQLLVGGSGSHEQLSLVVVILVSIAGELLGSVVGYLIGYYGGRPLVDRFGKYVLLTHKDLDRAEAWLDHHGEPLVLFGRLIPLLRSFVSLAAGLGEMAFAKFMVFTVIGTTIWCIALASLGDSLGSSYEHVLKSFSYAGYVVAVLAVLAVALLFWHRLRTLREERR